MSEILIDAPSTGRTAYTVVPNPDEPVILQIDGTLIRVVEISAVGFSTSSTAIKSGRRYPFAVDLPTSSRPISGYLDVLPSGNQKELQCRFVDLPTDDLDLLHRYVLIRQKEAIRAIKAGNSFHTHD